MKQRKTARPPFLPGEADVLEATQALLRGDERPVAEYLRDLSRALGLLSNPRDAKAARRCRSATPEGRRIPVAAIPDEDAKWEGNFLQIKEAIEQGKAETVGLYLRDAAEFLGRLAGLIDGQASSSDWRLEFRRKGRGRRSDPVSRMLKDSPT